MVKTVTGSRRFAERSWLATVTSDYMPPDNSPAADIAHVVYLDIVGYSRLPMIEQRQLLEELNQLVREAVEASRSSGSLEVLRLPTGDGMALVFFHDLAAPVECAIRVARSLRTRSYLQVRMGLHTGPVYRIQDINAHANAAGSGINVAQQIMAFGDAGHILVSVATKELMGQLRDWSRDFHDLGTHPDKHGRPLRVFNFYNDEIGNPDRPRSLAGPGGPASPSSVPHRREVVLLHRAGAEPDDTLARMLDAKLAEYGCDVVVDRPDLRGLDSLAQLAVNLRRADAVIPLLSVASVGSEVLEYAIQAARDAAASRGDGPRLIPVRVNYEVPLPESLATICDGSQTLIWSGPQDDQHLSESLVSLLGRDHGRHEPEKDVQESGSSVRDPDSIPKTDHPTAQRPHDPTTHLIPIGALPIESPFYLTRPTDAVFNGALEHHDSIVLIHGARQMGKTSLLARGLHQARSRKAAVVHTDFQRLNSQHLESADALLRTLARWLARALGLEVSLDAVWDPLQGPNLNFTDFMLYEVLEKIPVPVVWGLDEVDRLFPCPFSGEVFGLFRTWHNERAFQPGGPWSRLTLAIAYATEAHLFITDLNQSPFNVGTRISLKELTPEQVSELNARYGSPLKTDLQLSRLYELTGGHPYLSNRALHALAGDARSEFELETLEMDACREDGLFGDHLRRMLILLASEPALCEAMKTVLRGGGCPDHASFYRLRSAGVVAGELPGEARPRCAMYQRYLKAHLG